MELVEPRGDLDSGEPGGSWLTPAAPLTVTGTDVAGGTAPGALVVVDEGSTAVDAAVVTADVLATGWVTLVAAAANCDDWAAGGTTAAGVAGWVARQYASRNSAKCSQASSNWFSSRITSNISCQPPDKRHAERLWQIHCRATKHHPHTTHSATCHPTQMNAPQLNPSQTDRYSIYLPEKDRSRPSKQ